jgi:DNA-binding CsgD family transcriptional regulator
MCRARREPPCRRAGGGRGGASSAHATPPSWSPGPPACPLRCVHCRERFVNSFRVAADRAAAARRKPRRDAITGRDALTAGELRVARLAAEGLTNREIAQALFVTRLTAKAHLNRVYRKLEISRRGELTAALAGELGESGGDLHPAAPVGS